MYWAYCGVHRLVSVVAMQTSHGCSLSSCLCSPELMEGEVILAGMAAKDARKLEEELHSKLKLRQDEQDDLGRQDEVDKQEEDAVLAQYKALMGFPNSYDR